MPAQSFGQMARSGMSATGDPAAFRVCLGLSVESYRHQRGVMADEDEMARWREARARANEAERRQLARGEVGHREIPDSGRLPDSQEQGALSW
jgi:hypothetical protein